MNDSSKVEIAFYKFLGEKDTLPYTPYLFNTFNFSGLPASSYLFVWTGIDAFPKESKGKFFYQLKIQGDIKEQHFFRIE